MSDFEKEVFLAVLPALIAKCPTYPTSTDFQKAVLDADEVASMARRNRLVEDS